MEDGSGGDESEVAISSVLVVRFDANVGVSSIPTNGS